MRIAALATLTALLAVVACEVPGTAPIANIDATVRNADGGTYVGGNPPPPPIDSGSVGVAQDAEASAPTLTFNLSVTYFLNKPENSGWLKFKRDADDTSIDIDNSAAIRMTDGVFSGKGIVRIIGPDYTAFIDLSKVSYGKTGETSFESCDAALLTSDSRSSCFNVQMTDVRIIYADGTTHAGIVYLRPTKTETCSIDRTACVITTG